MSGCSVVVGEICDEGVVIAALAVVVAAAAVEPKLGTVAAVWPTLGRAAVARVWLETSSYRS